MDHMDKRSCVFIFAGYTPEMEEFTQVNAGLSRRVPFSYTFEPYTRQELFEILTIKAEQEELVIRATPEEVGRLLNTVRTEWLATQTGARKPPSRACVHPGEWRPGRLVRAGSTVARKRRPFSRQLALTAQVGAPFTCGRAISMSIHGGMTLTRLSFITRLPPIRFTRRYVFRSLLSLAALALLYRIGQSS